MNNPPAEKNWRVLVVDDNRAIHDDFRKILCPATATAMDATEAVLFGQPQNMVTQTQFEVDSAYQGNEGVLLAARALEAGRPYAVAFVDVRMPPGWDGVETTGKLWELDSDLQVVLCTAYSDYSWSEMFEQLGPRDGLLILKKPFDAVEAFQMAHALTEKWWLTRQARGRQEDLEQKVNARTHELQQTNHALHTEVAEHQRAEATLLERTRIANLEADVGTALNRGGTLAEMLRLCCEAIMRHLDAAFARIWTFNEWEQMLELHASAGMYTHLNGPHGRVPVGKFKIGLIAKARQPHLTNQVVGDPLVGDQEWARREGMVAFAGFPLLVEDRLTGVVAMFARHPLTDVTLQALASISNHIALGIERKRAETELLESEERFSGAFEHAPIGVALVSTDGHWLQVNRALCELVGYSEAELLTRTFQDITHPEDLEADLENLRQLLTAKIRAYEMEKRYIHRSGHLVTVLLSVSLVRDGQGQPRYLIAQIQDITERKRTEESLRLLGSAVEQAKESIVITDAEINSPGPKVVFVNPAYTTMTGYSAAEVIGNSPWISQGPRTERAVLDRLRQNLERGEVFAGETINYRKDGTEFNLEWQIAPLRNARGIITHFVSIQRDITERKAFEEALRQAQKLESIGHLAAGIAHEINTPTQFIGDNTQFIRTAFNDLQPLLAAYERLLDAARRQTVSPGLIAEIAAAREKADLEYLLAEVPKAISQSIEGIERVTKIVRAMKEFSHPGTAGKVLLDLNHAIESTLTVCHNEWKYVAELVTEFDPQLPLVPVLPGEFNQVILNLVINAAHAIADVVGAGGQGKGKITLSTRCDGNGIEVRIRDTGTGIPEKARERVFDPFFTTKAVGKGTGQGLAIARSVIVDKHGGTLSFETESGKGTCFIIRLPAGATSVDQPRKAV